MRRIYFDGVILSHIFLLTKANAVKLVISKVLMVIPFEIVKLWIEEMAIARKM